MADKKLTVKIEFEVEPAIGLMLALLIKNALDHQPGRVPMRVSPKAKEIMANLSNQISNQVMEKPETYE